MMTPKKSATLLLLVSLAFASAILVSSYLMPSTESKMWVTGLLIAAWWIPFSWLTAASNRHSLRKELVCVRRSITRLFKSK